MKQTTFFGSITATFAVVGLALGNPYSNSTLLVKDAKVPIPAYSNSDNNEVGYNAMPYIFQEKITNERNWYKKSSQLTQLEKESMELFGKMRDATREELEATRTYVESISTPTGVTFFD